MSKLLCDIYRSPREQEMYLYVQKQEGLARVPDKLQELFGEPVHVTTLILTPERTLARAEAETVIKQLQEQGFYLQMPPVVDDEMRAIAAQNSKLSRG
ncbi:YcgL domain-containing protein [Microbulbifer agarilyticus]|uniref:YcgL domain-containing protein n=1 Tax=Microbulbifer agarilyticus TaxID=260552 RepID=UPI001C95F4BF|nr:YcgL domain-containing protein [Microbulbifer agarilyticus]MBY6190475.1 YcgL domain-containing protein [Microbulbifer agarilyticus]MCA0892959.1 YcgL domain-containing protein [Microbulbifer agarilyticus]